MTVVLSPGDVRALLAQTLAHRAADDPALTVDEVAAVADCLLATAANGERLGPEHLEAARHRGAVLAGRGVDAHDLLDVHLTLAARLAEHLTGESAAGLLWAVRDVTDATVEGYVSVRRSVFRREVLLRRELVDDLLGGQADAPRLVDRAARAGIRLGPPRPVLVVRGDQPVEDDAIVLEALATALRRELGTDDLLVATKDAAVVCVLPPVAGEGRDESTARAVRTCLEATDAALVRETGAWRAAVGDAHAGADGVRTSYVEAGQAVRVAGALGLAARVVDVDDVVVHRLLLADPASLEALVLRVLGPLEGARGGAGPLVGTLNAYFDAGGVAVAAADALFLSVRALTYRLHRVRVLTGRDPADPHHRYVLQTAAAGARLLGWPDGPRAGVTHLK